MGDGEECDRMADGLGGQERESHHPGASCIEPDKGQEEELMVAE